MFLILYLYLPIQVLLRVSIKKCRDLCFSQMVTLLSLTGLILNFRQAFK